MDGGQVTGIVTDRDIVVRGVAEGIDAESTSVSHVCTTGVETIEPEASVDEALSRMREKDIRRLPVAKNGRPVGITRSATSPWSASPTPRSRTSRPPRRTSEPRHA